MLSIVATPIGNLEDISLRALRTLKEADAIVCEDKREIVKILRHYQVPQKPLIPFYEEIEDQKRDDLLKLIAGETKVVLVSDSGTPLISDPGYKLVREATKLGIKVEAIPGPCAAITALILSGLPPDKFTFWGFPKKNKIEQTEGTNIYYVSPHKLLKFLASLNSLTPPNPPTLVVCRELTKIFEEVWSGNVQDAMIKFAHPKGELVVLWHL